MNAPALDAFWMPFTPNRQFKAAPRLVVSAQGLSYRTPEGREVLDGCSGLWCVGAGHRHPRIAEAMKRQIDTLDFASNFQVGHPLAFERAEWQWQADPVWTAELEAYERKVSPVTGRSQYSAPEGLHDDTVIGRALMLKASQRWFTTRTD